MSKPLENGDTVAWRRRKDQRPQEILAAARQLIEEEGAAATSMARIARLAGVSEATVYKYFDSKQELLNQVLTDWATPFVERLNSELQHFSGVRAQLTLIAIRFLRSMEETPKLHRVVFQEIRWIDYRGSPLHRINHDFAHRVVAVVEDGIRNGEVRPGTDPVMLRDMLFGGLEHIALRTSFAGRYIDVEAEAARYVDMMLSGILNHSQDGRTMSDELGRLSGLVDRIEKALG